MDFSFKLGKFAAAAGIALALVGGSVAANAVDATPTPTATASPEPMATIFAEPISAPVVIAAPPVKAGKVSPVIAVLNKLAVKGRAPKTGYERSLFGDGWGDIGNCSVRNFILKRDLKNITWREGFTCQVASGVFTSPYSGQVIAFKYGKATSYLVPIEHVVAVGDAWQKGAQQWSATKRVQFYNDPLNLLAVDLKSNSAKGDSDAASWLPPNKSYRCAYVARQVAVKSKYGLWVTSAEKSAIAGILAACPTQQLPR
ncbi:MAG: hypothetical protein RL118_1139 [Actinomycetota bacterium]|jgi:hypothetical protein